MKVKMSEELFNFLKENRTKGIILGAWPEKLKQEFIKYRPDNYKSLEWHGRFGPQIVEGYGESIMSIAYCLKQDTELMGREPNYSYYIPSIKEIHELGFDIYEICIKDMTTPNLGIVYIKISDAPSFEGFAGYEHEKDPGIFHTCINYHLGKVTRVRFKYS